MSLEAFWFKRQNLIIGLGTVIAFFLIWEAIFAWFVPLNTFVLSTPNLIFKGWGLEIASGQLVSDLKISGKPFLFGFGSAVSLDLTQVCCLLSAELLQVQSLHLS